MFNDIQDLRLFSTREAVTNKLLSYCERAQPKRFPEEIQISMLFEPVLFQRYEIDLLYSIKTTSFVCLVFLIYAP